MGLYTTVMILRSLIWRRLVEAQLGDQCVLRNSLTFGKLTDKLSNTLCPEWDSNLDNENRCDPQLCALDHWVTENNPFLTVGSFHHEIFNLLVSLSLFYTPIYPIIQFISHLLYHKFAIIFLLVSTSLDVNFDWSYQRHNKQIISFVT